MRTFLPLMSVERSENFVNAAMIAVHCAASILHQIARHLTFVSVFCPSEILNNILGVFEGYNYAITQERIFSNADVIRPLEKCMVAG
jgi:hypothetical protein